MRLYFFGAVLAGTFGLCSDFTDPPMRAVDATEAGRAVRSVRVVPDTQRLEFGGDTGQAKCEPRNTRDTTGIVLANRCKWLADTAAVKLLVSGQSVRIVPKRSGFHFIRAMVKQVGDTGRVAALDDLASAPMGAELYDTVVSVLPEFVTLDGAAASATLQGHCRDPFTGPLSPTPSWTWTVRNATILDAVSSTKSAITITPNADGQTYVVGTCAGEPDEPDSARVTVINQPPVTDLPYAAALPSGWRLRTVNVSTNTQFLNALAAALPGDSIHLAAGTYSGAHLMNCGVAGTTANPIVITGPSVIPQTAILNGGNAGSSYGLRIRGPNIRVSYLHVRNYQFGIAVELTGCTGALPHNVVLDRVKVGPSRQNGITLRQADGAYVQRSRIDSACTKPTGATWTAAIYCEGMYIGSSSSTAEMTDNFFILGNEFGPGIHHEHIDIKGLSGGRSSDGLIQGNRFDATGTIYQTTTPTATAVMMEQGGADNQIIENRVFNITYPSLAAFAWYTSARPYAWGNKADSANTFTGGFAFRVQSSSATPILIYCNDAGTNTWDNLGTPTSGYTCTPGPP
jgi:hypothetical protein